MKKKIIFVYNADSDFFSSVSDFAHKIISPGTYKCNLCKITYGNLGAKKKWKEFVSGLKFETEFLHKDEFVKKYGMKKFGLPAIYIEETRKLKLVVSSKEINSIKNLDGMIKLVKKKLTR